MVTHCIVIAFIYFATTITFLYAVFLYLFVINDTIKLTKVGFVEMFIENRICKNKLLGLCKKYYTRKVGGAL